MKQEIICLKRRRRTSRSAQKKPARKDEYIVKYSTNEVTIPNPALKPFEALIGEWETTGAHPHLPDIVLHGRSSFEWIEGGAFVLWRSELEDERFPRGTAILGSDDGTGEFFMIYFDNRKVSRKYDVSIRENTLKWWRTTADFSQRFTWTLTDNHDSFIQKGEMCKDGSTWEGDLELTFARVKKPMTDRPGRRVRENMSGNHE